jgi:hypothetical protein
MPVLVRHAMKNAPKILEHRGAATLERGPDFEIFDSSTPILI